MVTFAIFFAVIGDWAFEDMKKCFSGELQRPDEELDHDIERMAPAADPPPPIVSPSPNGEFELQANPSTRHEVA